MFDDQGIWHEEVYNQPQGGALGALNILNQFQSFNNYRKNTARQTLADLSNQATLGEKHGQDFSQYPEGEGADTQLGISHGTAQTIFGNVPQEKLKQAIAAAQAENPDEPLSAERLSTIYSSQGITPPANVVRSQAESRKAAATRLTTMNKAMDQIAKTYVTQGLPDNEVRKNVVDNLHVMNYGGGERPEEEQRLQEYLQAAGTAAGPKVTAQIGLTTAKTETEGEKKAHIAAQTETLDALRDPQVQKTLAQAGLDRERRVLLGIKEGIERDKAANGGLTAAGRVTAKAKLAQFAVQMAAQQKDANYSVGAEQARHRQAIKTLQEMSDSVRADLDRGTADKAYPPNSKIKLKTGEVIQTDANGKPIAQPNADANSPF